MQVIMSWEAFRKMRAYVNSSYPEKDAKNEKISLKEITGWGTVDQLPNGNLYIEEVFLMPQEATAAHVEMDMDGWSNMITELAMGEHADKLGKLNMWWHSHPFATSADAKNPQFSSTDTGTMERFHLEGGFLLSIVTDQYGNMTARYDQWSPVRQRLEVGVTIEYPPMYVDDLNEVRPEVVEKVTFPDPPKIQYGNSTYGNQGQTQWNGGGKTSSIRSGRGKWAVWRIPPTGKPYEVDRYRKKAEAEQACADKKVQMSNPKLEAVYVVIEGNGKPQEDGSILEVDTEGVDMWVVRRKDSDFDIQTHGTKKAAEEGMEKILSKRQANAIQDELEVVKVCHFACLDCGNWREVSEIDGICDDCDELGAYDADALDMAAMESTAWEGMSGWKDLQ